jgi:hypothetical protein
VINLGAISLPVRLQIGDGEPTVIGELPLTLAHPAEDYRIRIATEDQLRTQLSLLLSDTAHKLRKGETTDAAPPGP